MRRDLCESAKRGHLCCDDLCHGNPDDTLCGFDQSFYEEIAGECEGEQYEDEDYCEEMENERAKYYSDKPRTPGALAEGQQSSELVEKTPSASPESERVSSDNFLLKHRYPSKEPK